MASSKISLKIVTPEGVSYEGEVSEFTAPSVLGEFGVLPEHRPALAGLRTGIVTLHNDGEAEQVIVGPGIVKVENDEAEILTASFMKKADVDAVVYC